MTKQERLEKQKARFEEMQEFELDLRSKGYEFVAGVDEVGRGPLAGPVVAACVVLPEKSSLIGLDDSKKLTEKKREALYPAILEEAVCYGIGMEDNFVIDEINILKATKLAMRKAVKAADEMLASRGFDKQIDFVLFDAMKIDEVEKEQMSLIKGDARSISIAAASVVAKVTRDRMMVEYENVYPGYSFASNKGYGTKAHYEGIREKGITPIHRKSFLKNLK